MHFGNSISMLKTPCLYYPPHSIIVSNFFPWFDTKFYHYHSMAQLLVTIQEYISPACHIFQNDNLFLRL